MTDPDARPLPYWTDLRAVDPPRPVERAFQPGGWEPAHLLSWRRLTTTGEWFAEIRRRTDVIVVPATQVRPVAEQE